MAVGVGLALAVAAVPLVREAPDAILEITHPLRYERTIREASAEYEVEPTFVAGVIHTESRFDPEAESPRGAYGLMQILPGTAEFISERSGIRGDYRKPEVNIRMGVWYLGYLRDRYKDDERLVLAAYNSGEGQVDGWIREGRDLEREIPFRETHEYVDRVSEARDIYRELYGRNLDRDSR